MLFQTTPAHEELRAKIRAFAEEEIKPLAFLLDQNNEFPDEPVKKMAQLGWLGLPFPRSTAARGLTFSAMPSPWRSWPVWTAARA